MYKNYISLIMGRDAQPRNRKVEASNNSKNKCLLSMMLLFGIVFNGFKVSAQVASYGFAASSGSYTALVGGTTWQSGTTITTDAVSSAIALPWAFVYNGKSYSSIYISNNGFIGFANTATGIPASSNLTPISQVSQSSTVTNGYDGAIAGFGMDLRASSGTPTIIYGSSGSDFVVQYTEVARTGQAAERITFQIRLTQTTNVIKIVYNTPTSSNSTSAFPQVGLRGASAYDWKALSATSAATWVNPTVNNTAGTAVTSSTMRFTTSSTAAAPVAGQIYTFTPPAALTAPTYATLPASESFDGVSSNWANGYSTGDLPSTSSWRTWPSYGDRSFRRDNISAGLSNGWYDILGPYTVASPASGGTARFHNYRATASSNGYMDYYVDFSSQAGAKGLLFDLIGADINTVNVYLSTDGGATFGAANVFTTSGTWTTKSLALGSSVSATCVIRFEAISSWGSNDIGIDNVKIQVPCSVPTGLAASASSAAASASTINGSFTVTAGTAPTGYIVVRSTSATAPATPAGGTALPSVGNTTTFVGGTTYVEYVNTTAGPWTSTSLNANTTYYYYVFSYNGGGCLNAYSASSTTSNATTCLAASTTSAATAVSSGAFTANWSAVTGATAYTFELASDSGFTQNYSSTPGVTGTSRPLTGLTNGLTYYYRVTATGGACSGVVSNVTSQYLLDALHGVYTIDNTLPTTTPMVHDGTGNFASFSAAINSLNSNGLSAAVTFNVTAGQTFSETVPFITATGTLANPVIFQKNGAGINPVISSVGGASTETAIAIIGGDYFTFDGIDIATTGSALEYGYYIQNSTATNGAQNNTFKNFTVTLNRLNTFSVGVIQIISSTTPATSAAGANSNNKFYNFTIKNTNAGILLSGQAGFPDLNCEIGTTACATRNTIGDPATANDIINTETGAGSAVWGIRVTNVSGIKIYNNDIANITTTGNNSVADGIFIDNNAATVALGTSEINNNKINLVSSSATGANANNFVRGIRVNGNAFAATINRVYNNFITNLQSGNTNGTLTTRRIVGIALQPATGGVGSGIYCEFNSVRIAATNLAISNSCLEIGTAATGPIFKVRNNILTNLTAAQSGGAKHYCWASPTAGSVGATGSLSNYNDLYVTGTNGFVGIGNATDYAALSNWQSGMTGQDVNSVSTDPSFTSATDLHATSLALKNTADPSYATNTAWATLDIDCSTRSALTDIGADEIISCSGAVGGTGEGGASFCLSNTSALTLSATSYSSGLGSTYQWFTSTSSGNYPLSGTAIGSASPSYANLSVASGALTTTTYYWLKVTCSSGLATDYSTMITVTINQSAAGISGLSSKCSVDAAVTLTENGGTGTSWLWSPGGATTQSISVNPASTTDYTVTVTSPGGCISTVSKMLTVFQSPTGVTANASSSTICNGSTINLTSGSTSIPSPYTIISQNFENGTGAWAVTAASSGGVTTALANFNVRAHGWAGGENAAITFNSPGATNFILADPDGAGSGVALNTLLTSPTFSTVGYSAANLTFRHYYRHVTTNQKVQISTDGGSTWTNTLVTYSADAGSAAGFATANISLSSFLNQSNLKIRFNYAGGWLYYWAIDDIAVTGTPMANTYAWTSTPSGFTSATQNPTGVAPTVDTTYKVTVTTPAGGCTTEATTAVTVNPRPTSVVSGGGTVCNGATLPNVSIALTGTGPWNLTYSDGTSSTSVNPSSSPYVITGATAGTYTVTLLSDANCTANAGDKTGSATVIVNSRPTAALSGGAAYCNGESTTTNFSLAVTGSGTISGTLSDSTPFSGTAPTITVSVSPSSTTTYTIATLSDGNCTAIAGDLTGSATVTVNPIAATPTISAGGPTTFCAGGSVLLTSSAGSSYLWSNGETTQSITVSIGGSYTVQVTNSFGCLSLASAATTVTVTAQPLWYLDADNDLYYTGSAVVQCTSPGAGYTTATLTGGGDCADGNSAINPGVTEVCYNNIDDNCNLTLSEGCAAVPVNMTASYNGTTLPSLATAIPAVAYTYLSVTNLKYRFSITNVTTGVTSSDIIQSSRYVTIPAALHSSPGVYTIKASAVINDEIVAYSGNTVTVNAPNIPKITLAPGSCGATLAALTSTLTANAGLNATGYTFRIRLTSDNGPTPTYGTSSSSTRFVSANSFTGFPLSYGTSYQVAVQYSYTDPVTTLSAQSGYGAECTVVTPSIPTTSLASPTCGSQVATLNANISAAAASYAVNYQFRIRKTSDVGGPYTESAPNASRFSSLTAFGLTLAYNTQYSISVRYSVLVNGSPVWSNYGSECIVKTPFFPTTSLVQSQCGLEAATTLTQQLNIIPYPGFPNYKVRLQEVIGEDLGEPQDIVVTYPYFRLSQFSTAELGKNYNVSVAIKLGNVFGDFSTECDIHTPEAARTIKMPFTATAYPNPFANNFMIDVKTKSQSSVNLKVYDMVGRLIEQRDVRVSDMETTTIGERYPSGIYNVVVSQEDTVETVRVVKR